MRMYELKRELSYNTSGSAMSRLLMLMSQPEKAKRFYASDFDFTNGDVKSLHQYDIIEPTGNTKEVVVESYFNGDELKVTAKEWRVSKHFVDLCERLAKEGE